MPEMYVKYQDGRPVGYAYGEPWVAQALFMDDWQYPTEEEAIAAWEGYKDGGIKALSVLREAAKSANRP